ncbi:unnamed protein product [Protopolystoma xenopodis]|uniref:Tumor necrosis factor alpha-induced protein 8-like protein n=1 Tax=Protopolystoma xenopodis TaxID=117903 RepID=A0A448XDV5_9PLAT|nr:unnamed protein product [Protopolystoma xenopodis]
MSLSRNSQEDIGENEEERHFSASVVGIRMQKKLAGHVPKNMFKFFLDDTSSRVLDNIYNLVKLYTVSKMSAKKLMKDILKIDVKISILHFNNVMTEEEKVLTADFRECFHNIAEVILRMRNPRRSRLSGPDASISKLIELLTDAERIALLIIEHHLSVKSQETLQTCAKFFKNSNFFEACFEREEFRPIMNEICVDIEELLDRGLL